MKLFIKRLMVFSLAGFVILEILSRVFIDSSYFDAINTYNEKPFKEVSNLTHVDTKHVDYLFIGSSRIPATINTSLFSELSGGKTVVNAGRGYMTAGIHYQALKHKIKKYPNYLEGAYVFVEYSGTGTYTSNFKEDRLRVYEPLDKVDEAMPHLLLPHLDLSSLITFFKVSNNSLKVKLEILLLQSAFYRSIDFINEKFNKTPNGEVINKNGENLVTEGGIRNDNIELAQEKAVFIAEQQKQKINSEPIFSFQQLENSSICELNKVIIKNGGKLFLYNMPLHSIQQEVYASSKAKKNKQIFETWLKNNDISIIYNNNFTYNDSDFPDTWHLKKERRDEFTSLLFKSLEKTKASKEMNH